MRRFVSIVSQVSAVALAISAFGAGAASGDALCLTSSSPVDPCPAASVVPSGTAISVGLATSPISFVDVSGSGTRFACGGSTWAATTTNAGGGVGVPVDYSIASGGLTLTPCNSFSPSGCSLSITSGASGWFEWDSTLRPDGRTYLRPPTISYTCPPGYTCTYGTASSTMVALFVHGSIGPAGTNRIVFTNQSIARASGPAGCPLVMRFDATYRVTRVGAASTGNLAITAS